MVGPPEPILAIVGEDAELPCHLSPNVSLRRTELRWLREPGSSAVLVHRDGHAQDAEQAAGYRGRAALVQDGLSRGRAALRLRGVQVADGGVYRCLFRQDDSHAEASVSLEVAGESRGAFLRDPCAASV